MEQLDSPTKYHVVILTLDMITQTPGSTPGELQTGKVGIDLRDTSGRATHYEYLGETAVEMIKWLNTANLTTKSMHKRVLERLAADGLLPGTVVGTPDPPATAER